MSDDGRSPNKAQPDAGNGIVPGIAGVSETMLWSLYNRASESRRPDSILADPDSEQIQSKIDYEFARHFGEPQGSLAARAVEIDRVLRFWIERHPDGTVVSLGEGLETQGRRVDNGRTRWVSVDLPDAIRLRERFIAPTDRFRHVAVSALDPAWMDAVDPSSGVFIVAQGLLMYLAPDRVRELFVSIGDRFPGAELVFDSVPRWFSDLTLRGLQQTASYRLPSMPWGINRDEVEPTLRGWHSRVATVTFLSYQSPRGLPHFVAGLTMNIPVVRHAVPSLVHVVIAGGVQSAVPTAGPDEDAMNLGLKQHVAPRRMTNMTSIENNNAQVDAMVGFLAAATQNARCGSDIAIATTRVIAKRVALGVVASFNPLGADRAEFARMVPEKVEAFSMAGMVMLKQSGEANRKMMSFASDHVVTTTRAAIEMTRCGTPSSLAEAQRSFALAWFDRVTSSAIAMGIQAFEVQSAAMAPIRETVVSNAQRLAG